MNATMRRWAIRAGIGVVLLAVLLVGGTAFRVWQVARSDDRQPADLILVLGAAQYNGKPSEVLKTRLEHAKRLYDEGVAKTIMTVGGRKAGDNYTEAESGRRWLLGQGVPADNVIAVAEGSDTLGSMRAVAPVAGKHGWYSAVIVTDPWHSLRSITLAKDVGIDAWASPTRTGAAVLTSWNEYRYVARETGALLFFHLTHAQPDEVNAHG